jgi:hypothetical protein
VSRPQHCSNCGEVGHKFNRCGQPLITNGVVSVTDRRRGHRRRNPNRQRARTIALKKLTRAVLSQGRLESGPPVEIQRPRTRSECPVERPCPWVACKHHLYLDINPETGSIKLNFPDLEPWELQHSCALDAAEHGGLTLDETGELLNVTREQIRNIEVRGLLKLKMREDVREGIGPGPILADRDEAIV